MNADRSFRYEDHGLVQDIGTIGDLKVGDVTGDGRLDLVLLGGGPRQNLGVELNRTECPAA